MCKQSHKFAFNSLQIFFRSFIIQSLVNKIYDKENPWKKQKQGKKEVCKNKKKKNMKK